MTRSVAYENFLAQLNYWTKQANRALGSFTSTLDKIIRSAKETFSDWKNYAESCFTGRVFFYAQDLKDLRTFDRYRAVAHRVLRPIGDAEIGMDSIDTIPDTASDSPFPDEPQLIDLYENLHSFSTKAIHLSWEGAIRDQIGSWIKTKILHWIQNEGAEGLQILSLIGSFDPIKSKVDEDLLTSLYNFLFETSERQAPLSREEVEEVLTLLYPEKPELINAVYPTLLINDLPFYFESDINQAILVITKALFQKHLSKCESFEKIESIIEKHVKRLISQDSLGTTGMVQDLSSEIVKISLETVISHFVGQLEELDFTQLIDRTVSMLQGRIAKMDNLGKSPITHPSLTRALKADSPLDKQDQINDHLNREVSTFLADQLGNGLLQEISTDIFDRRAALFKIVQKNPVLTNLLKSLIDENDPTGSINRLTLLLDFAIKEVITKFSPTAVQLLRDQIKPIPLQNLIAENLLPVITEKLQMKSEDARPSRPHDKTQTPYGTLVYDLIFKVGNLTALVATDRGASFFGLDFLKPTLQEKIVQAISDFRDPDRGYQVIAASLADLFGKFKEEEDVRNLLFKPGAPLDRARVDALLEENSKPLGKALRDIICESLPTLGPLYFDGAGNNLSTTLANIIKVLSLEEDQTLDVLFHLIDELKRVPKKQPNSPTSP